MQDRRKVPAACELGLVYAGRYCTSSRKHSKLTTLPKYKRWDSAARYSRIPPGRHLCSFARGSSWSGSRRGSAWFCLLRSPWSMESTWSMDSRGSLGDSLVCCNPLSPKACQHKWHRQRIPQDSSGENARSFPSCRTCCSCPKPSMAPKHSPRGNQSPHMLPLWFHCHSTLGPRTSPGFWSCSASCIRYHMSWSMIPTLSMCSSDSQLGNGIRYRLDLL
mmetsp:Transcript_35835/g.65067  ORF Transcript_35835/g.65067 Transcript_35835/m.65067 type:complete len:219 (-) Transcript_35835:2347-3003(-)